MIKKRIMDKRRMEKKKARNAITALGHFLTLVIQVRESTNGPRAVLTFP